MFPTTYGEGTHFSGHFQITDEIKDCRVLFQKLQANLSSAWETYYIAAKQWYQENGNLRVQELCDCLGTYTGKLDTDPAKSLYRHSDRKSDKRKVRKLNEISMIWDVRDHGWNEALTEMQAYYKEHGNLDIRARYETADGFKLGRWICNLRTKVKTKGLDKALTKEQQEQLAALGMIWDRNTEKWEEYFEAAQEYYRQHGNLEVMAKYVTEEGLPLGRWLSDISNKVSDENLRRVSLTDEQLERLKSIGFKQEKRQLDNGMRNMSWQRIITKYMEI